MYDNGQGVPQDYSEAVRWFRKAADQGLAKAQHNIGGMYAKGHRVPQDYSEAVKWYRKAADQGYAGAQLNLGFLYANGFGVTQDYSVAVNWYGKAAEQGYTLGPVRPRVNILQRPGRSAGQCAGAPPTLDLPVCAQRREPLFGLARPN
jgi:TPR repeat protein